MSSRRSKRAGPERRGNAMLHRRAFIALATAALVAAAAARAEAPRPINTLGSVEGIAIRGYDPVAYFRDGGPRPGKPEFALRYAGAVWHFASAEHKALFLSLIHI